jgi:hypothetical protein
MSTDVKHPTAHHAVSKLTDLSLCKVKIILTLQPFNAATFHQNDLHPLPFRHIFR